MYCTDVMRLAEQWLVHRHQHVSEHTVLQWPQVTGVFQCDHGLTGPLSDMGSAAERFLSSRGLHLDFHRIKNLLKTDEPFGKYEMWVAPQ